MEVFKQTQTREEYFDIQVNRSREKFQYCKVSARDVMKYREIIHKNLDLDGKGMPLGPILCLGTRNGREVDLFRCLFFCNPLIRSLVKTFETRTHSYISRFPAIEAVNRSNIDRLHEQSVIGIELNPDAKRKDIGILSFDQMPENWEGRFSVLYSNAFDQSQDPQRTAGEWKRVTRKGGIMILCYTVEVAPSYHDPVGMLSRSDFMDLFPGELLYYKKRGSQNGYSEIIISR